jgi:RHH-type proline utilization regulon transcriptional repressor/proline dehydrogenase/delta 1-pyrroline-5-carboxylate dehydrogenase
MWTAGKEHSMLILPTLDTTSSRRLIRELRRGEEGASVSLLLDRYDISSEKLQAISQRAISLIEVIRRLHHYGATVNALLNEYSLSSREGVVLMCLAEALLRVPDKLTADRLISDKLGGADWQSHIGHSHSLFVNASAWGLLLTGKFIDLRQSLGDNPWDLLRQTVGLSGEPAIRAAMRLAMRIMGTQFVLGRDIGEAIEKSANWEQRGYRYTYDMLGEAARTNEYAKDYFRSYCDAIEKVGRHAESTDPVTGPGFSIKLSALHPRYELAQYDRLRQELTPRVLELATLAREHGLGLTIDAEESQRLDLLLSIFEELYTDISLRGWEGFGIAVQAYLKSAPAVIDWLTELAKRQQRKIPVRLVKGAYWDAEIKLAQALGHGNYPVFTRKVSSDLAFLVCAHKLLQSRNLLFPQFATHNAYSAAAVLELAGDTQGYEFQRLHGMGEELFDELIERQGMPVACRIYSPVGVHKDLLAYLVRRLLENGANSSFVHNIANDSIPASALAEDPATRLRSLDHLENQRIPPPRDIYTDGRRSAAGVDLSDLDNLREIVSAMEALEERIAAVGCRGSDPGAVRVLNPAKRDDVLGYYKPTDEKELDTRLQSTSFAFNRWSTLPAVERAAILRRAAALMEGQMFELAGFCIKEAGKTLQDSIADVREAIDFCRYYADGAEDINEQYGELYQARGVVLCISPWNFPVAIFAGQVSAALVSGNTVLAKPAEQTTLTGIKVVQLFHQAGVPEDALQLVIGPGEPIGAQLLPDHRISQVMFTGSTKVARYIARTVAERDGETVPVIAETGGQNCMVIDSTALLERVVDDVIASAFNSAGQRCSALRVLFVQDEIADQLVDMLLGAMNELCIGDPCRLDTDIGPVIDEEALNRLQDHVAYMETHGRLLHQCSLMNGGGAGFFFPPRLYEIDSIHTLPEEVFGPIVHIVRYRADELESLPEQINSSGYGLTFGVHSRIESTVEFFCKDVNAGNIYVNRNIIGAVVGVQPFGGRGLSGTGPKAGGPLYLLRLLRTTVLGQPSDSSTGEQFAITSRPLESPDWCDLSSNLIKTLEHWRTTPMAQRIERATRLPESLAISGGDVEGIDGQAVQLIKDLVDQANTYAFPVELPGPTGETNSLIFEGRGLLACVVHSCDRLSHNLLSVAAALLAGNTVLFLCDSGAESLVKNACSIITAAGFPQEVFAVSIVPDISTLEEIILNAPIAGAISTGNSWYSTNLRRTLARRNGGILPLIDDPFGPNYLSRYFYEKTISVNTAAAGGNAALLSQGELD